MKGQWRWATDEAQAVLTRCVSIDPDEPTLWEVEFYSFGPRKIVIRYYGSKRQAKRIIRQVLGLRALWANGPRVLFAMHCLRRWTWIDR